MRRLDRGPSRRERRAATKGIPAGHRATRVVRTTYGRHQRARDLQAQWAAIFAALCRQRDGA